MSWLVRLGEESDFFFSPSALGSEGEPFPMQEALPSQLTVSADTVGSRPVFHAAIYPQTPRAPRGARPVTGGCDGTSLSVLGESPPGVALRSGGGHTGEGSALLPGHLCPWRTPGRSGTWKAGGCARRDSRACGVGSGELDGGCGEWRTRRPSGGHRGLRDPPPRAGAPFLSDPSPGRAASLLTQMCGDQGRRGGGSLRRCSAARDAAQAPAT